MSGSGHRRRRAKLGGMRVTALVDYTVRSALELAEAHPGTLTADAVANRQKLPVAYTKKIMVKMRLAGLVAAQRGGEGGYRLARPPDGISVADIIRAVEGPLADVRGEPPETLDYPGEAQVLQTLWIATRASLRSVLEQVTLADLASGHLPHLVDELTTHDGAWHRR
jgi:Rrf2 family protein